jgi:signal peptide peptidase SppA
MSKVLDILNSPWAMEPRKHEQIVAIYSAYIRGDKIDIAAIEAQIGKPLQNEEQGYQIIDGVAVIPVQGVIAKRMNLFSRISGGVSTQLVSRDLHAALADSRVHAIMLDIDSPGGTVDGTQGLAAEAFAARAQKPIVAYADGMMTSGAYWIGSACEEVYISGDTVITGSIGVATQHADVSKANEKYGVTVTDIYAGKYKRIASENKPLSDEGRAAMQEIVDQLYSVFVNDVARNRGVDTDAVLKNMADGRLFVGRPAIQAGLVDGVSTFHALIAELVAGTKPANRV